MPRCVSAGPEPKERAGFGNVNPARLGGSPLTPARAAACPACSERTSENRLGGGGQLRAAVSPLSFLSGGSWGLHRDLLAPAALLFCQGLGCPALPELLCCGGRLNSSAFPVISAGAGVLNVLCGEPSCLSALPRAREEGLGKKAALWLFPGVLSSAGWFESYGLES